MWGCRLLASRVSLDSSYSLKILIPRRNEMRSLPESLEDALWLPLITRSKAARGTTACLHQACPSSLCLLAPMAKELNFSSLVAGMLVL